MSTLRRYSPPTIAELLGLCRRLDNPQITPARLKQIIRSCHPYLLGTAPEDPVYRLLWGIWFYAEAVLEYVTSDDGDEWPSERLKLASEEYLDARQEAQESGSVRRRNRQLRG